ncbi:Glycosyl hydrolase family 115 [Gracilimonas mengyeensis]|uniref:Glycosyl hydrolase family 115 n=2 Tax=Gracilimonas mengyeensis TaxID=1302730 RepID=A0A521ATC9_9BACT|nr:Glycosyl hydrolase family 115 [Gracilimonas mengyeensis]
MVVFIMGQVDVLAQQKLGLNTSIISETNANEDAYPLVSQEGAAVLWYDEQDYKGVIRAIGDLQTDIERVTDLRPEMSGNQPEVKHAVIVGTVGKSAVLDELISNGKLDADQLTGKWESFVITAVQNPVDGVEQALVIAGSDKRGTIYGIYELSEQIGVSPWYYWMDVPVNKKDQLFVEPGFYYSGEPKVKYRGIFINDEAPALTNWAKEKFGGFNHQFYEKVFELILRNRGNYLWPAMWIPTAFNDDDPLNPKLADEYGVVMSTSHHEPMMRAHDEWSRYGEGAWNYETNKETLQEFWRGGIERMGEYESVVTVGMRGDGDEALSEETAIDLLQTIIDDQREIIEEVTGEPAVETPQVWALYKEVQDYYDEGMRVDEDIMILFSDDNWGNVRYLPKKEDWDYKGGYGMYYHFDYVGGPVSYRWQNVTQIEKVWEQMNLTYQWQVDDLWIVNVGDIKPMEFPISFFLDLAWNPEAIDAADLPQYYVNWAEKQFGATYAEEIAEVVKLYSKYSARRTHEMITPETFSIENYREADRVLEEWKQLYEKAQSIYDKLPESHQSAFYQLGLFPVESTYNLNKMYVAAGKNKYYAERGAAAANYYADQVIELFEKDAQLAEYYHEELEDGKWNHMMSQTHIGYTYWNHPPVNKMPAVSYVQTQEEAELGFLIEYGAQPPWGWIDVEGDWWFQFEMPAFNPVNDQDYYIDILNRGKEPLSYSITSKQEWIEVSSTEGTIDYHEKVYVSIDWEKAPKEQTSGEIVISGPIKEHTVKVLIEYPDVEPQGFVEYDGVISINAADYQQAVSKNGVEWITVPNLGRTNSSVTIEPANAERKIPGENAPYLEYEFTVFDSTEIKVDTYLSPTLNYKKNEGLKYGIAINEEEPQIINMHEGEEVADWEYPAWWNNSVTDHIKIKKSQHQSVPPGTHTLKVWMVDPGVVFQKFVIDAGGVKPSYLGPPVSEFVE